MWNNLVNKPGEKETNWFFTLELGGEYKHAVAFAPWHGSVFEVLLRSGGAAALPGDGGSRGDGEPEGAGPSRRGVGWLGTRTPLAALQGLGLLGAGSSSGRGRWRLACCFPAVPVAITVISLVNRYPSEGHASPLGPACPGRRARARELLPWLRSPGTPGVAGWQQKHGLVRAKIFSLLLDSSWRLCCRRWFHFG